MRQARAFFQIIPVGSSHPRLLAIGGQGAYSTLDTSEWWQEEDNSWEEGPTLTTTGRSSFSSLMAPPHLVCSDVEPPSYSCPAGQNPGQTCVFPTVEPGACLNYQKLQGCLQKRTIYFVYHNCRTHILPRRNSSCLLEPRQRVHLSNDQHLHQPNL